MKKLLTLILCWLLAFSAMAENTFKAYSSASVAGGYITSLNKVDGSFEDVVTQWVASVGTIVKTASTEMQGNNIGVWSGTGAGTLDLQWTATASNTYEATAQVDVQGEDDIYICAYVGITETGCKLIPALSKIQKVSVVADSVISSAFHLRLKHTGSDAFNVKTDDGKIEPWTPQAVNLATQEYFEAYGNTGTVASSTVDATFTTIAKSTLSRTGTWTGNSTFTAKTNVCLDIHSNIRQLTGDLNDLWIYKNAVNTGIAGDYISSTLHTIHANICLTPNESISIRPSASITQENGEDHRISITASAISENVVQSWQDGTEWTSYTPTVSGVTGGTATHSAWWKRDGDSLKLRGKIVWTSIFTGGSNLVITLPSGLSINQNIVSSVNNATLGWARFRDVGVNSFIGSVAYYSQNKVALYPFKNTAGTVTFDDNVTTTYPFTWVNGDEAYYEATIPIQGWSSTPTLYALPTRSEVFSANVAADGTVANATQNFVASCTNAAPSVCSLWSSFGTAPICWAHTLDITKRAEVTASTATTATVARTDTGTAFNLFCHLK